MDKLNNTLLKVNIYMIIKMSVDIDKLCIYCKKIFSTKGNCVKHQKNCKKNNRKT